MYGGRYDAPVERLVRLFRVASSPLAVVLLVLFNLVPLVGVLFLGWNVQSLLILYWLENGIIGLLAIGRILRAEGELPPPGVRVKLAGSATASRAVLVPFFLMHYGLFWLVHGIFVFTLPLFFGLSGAGAVAPPGPRWDAIAFAAAGLAISHGASFYLNYIGRREYLTTSPSAQMMAPYGRVLILHLTIIFGALVSMFMGSPVGAVAVLVAVKTIIDLALHLAEHRGARPAELFST